MEQRIEFNGVKVLLTTGQMPTEVQNHWNWADVVISVYSGDVRILKSNARVSIGTASAHV